MILFYGVIIGLVISNTIFLGAIYLKIDSKVPKTFQKIKKVATLGKKKTGAILAPKSDLEFARQVKISSNAKEGIDTKLEELV